jgi:asparagine synthase (glutamine-hydrolysing)
VGAILAIFGPRPRADLEQRLEQMLHRSTYRGKPIRYVEDGFVVAVQSLGWDASLAQHAHWVVAFHGFVGNWRDLAHACGLSLDEATSDAERVALCYSRFGDAIFPWLRGEFAMLIIDLKEQTVVAVRDVIGTRPLFHQHADGLMFIASEIRQVLAGSSTQPAMNRMVMASYLLYRPVQQDLTLDQSVRRVVPGSVWQYIPTKPDGTPHSQPYWTPPPTNESRRYNSAALAEELRALLDQAVTRATPSHSFAVALSGGLDSATIWALVANHAARGDADAAMGVPYSMVFPGMECDESVRIAAMRAKTGAEQYVEIDAASVDPLDYLEPDLAGSDGYLGCTSFHITLLSSRASAARCNSILTGFGEVWVKGSFRFLADDLSTGHWFSLLHTLANASPYRAKGRPRMPRLLNAAGLGRLVRLIRFFNPRAHQRRRPVLCRLPITGLPCTGIRDRNLSPRGHRYARQGLYHSLDLAQSSLVYEGSEQLAARGGVEIRQPLNDLDLVNFAFTTPPRAFTGGVREKHLLRIAMVDLLAPELRDLTVKTLFNEHAIPYVQAALREPVSAHWNLVRLGLVDALALDALRDELAECELTSSASESISLAPNTNSAASTTLLLSDLYLLEHKSRRFPS